MTLHAAQAGVRLLDSMRLTIYTEGAVTDQAAVPMHHALFGLLEKTRRLTRHPHEKPYEVM
tara:strand:- start:392 stop:574 length:183 start_codon:yes stop_codon:yes gene_type:complete